MSDNPKETTKAKGLFGETDRESGEYRFRSGYTQQVYTNAHFVPADEDAAPPHYYRPADKKAGAEPAEGEEKRNRRTGSGFAILLVICFLCSSLGGIAGALLTIHHYSAAENRTTQSTSEMPETAELSLTDAVQEESESAADGDVVLTAGEIYELARQQVVSITVETVSVDRFGYQVPSSVSGSGFILSEDGYILTNYHVIEDAAEGGFHVTVSLADGSVYIGKITGTEEEQDLAVIKIDKDGLLPVAFGDSDNVRVGDEIYVVGNPYGVLEYSMTVGHISALDREIATEENETSRKMFQIDADVYSGNSGGPVYDCYGRVIGIVSAKYTQSGYEGIGFAMPINDSLSIAYELLDKGYVSGKASLGVSFDERYNSVYSRYYRLPEGAYIYSVTTGSCAEKAGLQSGDIIMQIDSTVISDSAGVTEALKGYKAGDTATVTIYRDGGVYAATVTFDEAIPSHIFENTDEDLADITSA